MLTIAFVGHGYFSSIAAVRVQPVFDEQRIARHPKTEREVDQPGEGKSREQRGRRRPDRIGKRCPQLPSRSNSATIETSEVSLNSAMKLLTRPGMTCRRACGITISAVVFHYDRPKCACGLALPARDRLQAAADNLGMVGAGKQRDADQRAHQPIDREIPRQEQRQHVGREEQHRNQRNAAPELDEGDREHPDQWNGRAPPKANAMPTGIEATMPVTRHHQRHQQPAPKPGIDNRQSPRSSPISGDHDADAGEDRKADGQARAIRERSAAGQDRNSKQLKRSRRLATKSTHTGLPEAWI